MSACLHVACVSAYVYIRVLYVLCMLYIVYVYIWGRRALRSRGGLSDGVVRGRFTSSGFYQSEVGLKSAIQQLDSVQEQADEARRQVRAGSG